MSIKHFYSQTVADGTATSVVRPSDWNSNHNMIVNLSGNTLGSSQLSGQDIVFVGGNNVTLSADTAASKLVFSAAAGGGGVTVGNAELFPMGGNSTFSSLGQNSIYLQKFVCQSDISFNNIERRMSMALTASSTNSQSAGHTIDYGLYTLGSGASSTQYGLIASSQLIVQASFSSNVSAGFTISQGAGSVTNTSAGTANLSNLSGFKHLYLPFATTLTQGGFYAIAMRISSTSAVGAPIRPAMLDLSQINNVSVGKFFATATTALASNASNVGDFQMGVYSATSSNLPATINVSGLTNAISQNRMYIQFDS